MVAGRKKKAKKRKKVAPSEQASLINDMVDALVAIGGEGTAQVLGSDAAAIKIRGVISTQCASLDDAIGRGGIPLGRLSILHGPEMSGKSTLALHCVAECQRRGGVVVYIDKEYKLDPDYARAIGVDLGQLIISYPPHLERAYEVIGSVALLAKKWRKKTGVGVPVLVVFDSINAAITKAQYNGTFEDKHIAAQARVHSDHLPKVMPKISTENVALLFIAQNRANVGKRWGEKEQLGGGNAVRFYASLIMKVRSIGDVKEGEVKKARKTVVECKKNQIACPFGKAQFEIRHGVGVDQLGGLIDSAIKAKVLRKKKKKDGGRSNIWKFGDENLANGRSALRETLEADPELLTRVKEALVKAAA